MRPGYSQNYERNASRYRGRQLVFFDTIDAAYSHAEESLKHSPLPPIILIHSGTYRNEFLVIDSNVVMIGAGQSIAMSLIQLSAKVCVVSFVVSHNHYPGMHRHMVFMLNVAASGNVAENVIIERDNESTFMFGEGASHAYLGYVTIKVGMFRSGITAMYM